MTIWHTEGGWGVNESTGQQVYEAMRRGFENSSLRNIEISKIRFASPWRKYCTKTN